MASLLLLAMLAAQGAANAPAVGSEDVSPADSRIAAFVATCMNRMDPVRRQEDPKEVNPPLENLARYLRGEAVEIASVVHETFDIKPEYVGRDALQAVTYTLDDLRALSSKGWVGQPYDDRLMYVYSVPAMPQEIGKCYGGKNCKMLVQREFICSTAEISQVRGINPKFGPLTSLTSYRADSITLPVDVLNFSSSAEQTRELNQQIRLYFSGRPPPGL